MSNEDDDNSVPARIAKGVNQLDIDFSSFTLVGWLIAICSLVAGGAAALTVYFIVAPLVNDGRATGLAFFLAMVGVTVVTFQLLRTIASWLGFPIVRDISP